MAQGTVSIGASLRDARTAGALYSFRLALEALEALGASGHLRRQDLMRNPAAKFDVIGREHGAHAALAYQPFDAVVSKSLSGLEGQDPLP